MALLLREILNQGNQFPTDYELLPGEIPITNTCVQPTELPVLDVLGMNMDVDRLRIVNEVYQAAKGGIFQITNHAIARGVMENALTTTKNFFELPNDQLRRAAEHYGAYSSSFVHHKGHHNTAKYWRDTLPFYLPSGTIDYDDTAFLFNFRVGFYASLVKGVAENLVSCISEGLRLGKTYFDDQGLTTVRRLNLNSYPRCPCPNFTCGMAKHYDPDLLTITLEGGAHGLQILDENNQWQTVKAQPNALIVTVGTQMEVVSNGILKAPAHRVIVNDQRERTSICYAIAPANTSTVGPAVTGLPGARPAQYKNNYTYEEYLEQHMTNYRDTSVCFSKFKL